MCINYVSTAVRRHLEQSSHIILCFKMIAQGIAVDQEQVINVPKRRQNGLASEKCPHKNPPRRVLAYTHLMALERTSFEIATHTVII